MQPGVVAIPQHTFSMNCFLFGVLRCPVPAHDFHPPSSSTPTVSTLVQLIEGIGVSHVLAILWLATHFCTASAEIFNTLC